MSLLALRGEEHFSRVDQKVLDVMGLSITSDLSSLGSDRDAVIARLREISSGQINQIGTASVASDNAQIVLLRLGDDQTIRQVVGQYQQYSSSYAVSHLPDMLEWSKQPAAISYLASDFNLVEDPTQSLKLPQDTGFSVGVPARSIYSGVITLEIIKRSPEFSDAMKAWAKEAYALRLKAPAKFRQLMQSWWNKNKEAFSQRNYSAVSPIDIGSVPDSTPAPSGPAPQEKPAASPSGPQPAPSLQTSKSIAEVAPASETGIPWGLYVIIVVSIAAIIGAGYFLSKRSGKSP